MVDEHLLPNTTKGVVFGDRCEKFVGNVAEDAIGPIDGRSGNEALCRRPGARQFGERFGQVHDRLGLKIRRHPRRSQRAAWRMARILPEKGKSALVIAIDVTGHIAEAPGFVEENRV